MRRHWQELRAKNYQLKVCVGRRNCHMIMQLNKAPYTTSSLPKVISILKRTLPSIFSSQCYNDYSLPFSKEVEATELGHLYEHILLEYLALLNRRAGNYRDFRGVTSWDWEKDAKGTFHIKVDVGSDDRTFDKAIELTNYLMEQVLDSAIESIPYYQTQTIPALAFT